MSGSTLSIIIIPIVVVLALGAWIVAVHFAQRHPGNDKEVAPPATEVSGGAFEASGGRQAAPRRDATPAEARSYESDSGRGGGSS